MRKNLTLPLLFYLVPLSAISQSKPISSQPPSAALRPERNHQAEDAVAKLFDTVRKDAKLHPLSRIRNRREVQQLTCTVSVTGKIPRFANGTPVLVNTPADRPSALYETTNPGELAAELRKVALYERPRGRSGHTEGHRRYSVAVWSTQQEKGGKPQYWVGIELFWSAGAEFFLNHLSDAMEWKNEWKQFVAPECKGVE